MGCSHLKRNMFCKMQQHPNVEPSSARKATKPRRGCPVQSYFSLLLQTIHLGSPAPPSGCKQRENSLLLRPWGRSNQVDGNWFELETSTSQRDKRRFLPDECFHSTMSGKLFHGKKKSTVSLAIEEAIVYKRFHSHWANLCLEGEPRRTKGTTKVWGCSLYC